MSVEAEGDETALVSKELAAVLSNVVADMMDYTDEAVAKAVAPLKAEIATLRAELDGARND